MVHVIRLKAKATELLISAIIKCDWACENQAYLHKLATHVTKWYFSKLLFMISTFCELYLPFIDLSMYQEIFQLECFESYRPVARKFCWGFF